MKYVKMLGLAAVAAMALMAFGAGTASATTLFTDQAKTIKYPKGTTLHSTLAAGNSATLTSGGSTIATCTISTVHATQDNETGATVTGTVTKIVWEGCSQTTHTISTGKLHISHIAGGATNGTVTSSGANVTVQIFGVSCTYGTGEGTHLGTLVGGASPHLTIATTVTKTAGGFLCPNTAGWDATYVVTTPHAAWVGA
jgi:hypothetical protein